MLWLFLHTSARDEIKGLKAKTSLGGDSHSLVQQQGSQSGQDRFPGLCAEVSSRDMWNKYIRVYIVCSPSFVLKMCRAFKILRCLYSVHFSYLFPFPQLVKGNMPPAATKNLEYTPPDGGWGWVIVFASFISIGFSYAFPKSLTVYFKEIQEYFSVSYSQIAWVSSVMLATMYAAGQWPNYPQCSALMKEWPTDRY